MTTEEVLSGNTDAQDWAHEFVKLHGGDQGLMLSWFANAIETGRDVGRPDRIGYRLTLLVEAIRLTVEYVGLDVLRPAPGWSWYEAWHAVDPVGLEAWLDAMPKSAGGRHEPSTDTDVGQVPG